MALIHELPRPAIIGHRGASAHAPENTLAAFQLAMEHGADGIELDAKLSADGQVVVIHDQTVDRTTGAHGVVREMTLAQLKILDAGSFFSEKYANERIPTLEEVFTAVGGQTMINVELTNYNSPADALPDKVAELVSRYGLQERVLFSSFHPLNLFRIHRRLPRTPVAILTLEGFKGRALRGWLGRLFSPDFIHPYYTDVDEASLLAEHKAGRRVNVWTVDDLGDIYRLSKMGIDGIITDDPLLAKRALEER